MAEKDKKKSQQKGKKNYQQKMEANLNDLAVRIGTLLGKIESKARMEYEKQVKAWPAQLKAARERLEQLKTSGGEAWQDLKPGLEKAWKELKKSVDKAASRF